MFTWWLQILCRRRCALVKIFQSFKLQSFFKTLVKVPLKYTSVWYILHGSIWIPTVIIIVLFLDSVSKLNCCFIRELWRGFPWLICTVYNALAYDIINEIKIEKRSLVPSDLVYGDLVIIIMVHKIPFATHIEIHVYICMKQINAGTFMYLSGCWTHIYVRMFLISNIYIGMFWLNSTLSYRNLCHQNACLDISTQK